MKIIVLANQKGGVAKTSTCHALGTGLANEGYKVLLADLDAQCNLSDACGIDTETAIDTLYGAFKGECTVKKAIQPVSLNMDLLLGDLLFSRADSEFTQIGRERMFKKLIAPLQGEYDFCIVDTPPVLGIMLANALTAADHVIIPMTAGRFSVKGMKQLAQFIAEIREDRNPNLNILGALLTMYTDRYNVSKIMREEVQHACEMVGTELFTTTIRRGVVMDESQVMQTDIFSQRSDLADDYRKFIKEFFERIQENGN